MARQFGATWWGRAWVEALEERADGDGGRLSRGRTYARHGKVAAAEVLPGRVVGRVVGKEEYTADVSVRPFTDGQWDSLIDLIVGRAAHAAALLTGELPAGLRDEAAAQGLPILPLASDLVPDCSCPDWGDPCKHAAALSYLIADLIDVDPFVVLLLRGRSRSEILDEVRRRRTELTVAEAEVIDLEAPETEGPEALTMQTWRSECGVLPVVQSPDRVGRPVLIPHHPPVDSGVTMDGMRMLVADAADRAAGFLFDGDDLGLRATVEADGARRAARVATDSESFARLADQLGLEPADLAIGALAWRVGGYEGFRVATEAWRPDPSLLEPGRGVLDGRPRTSGNTVSGGGVQLRLDRSGSWWRFEANDTLGWVLASGGFEDPADAVAQG